MEQKVESMTCTLLSANNPTIQCVHFTDAKIVLIHNEQSLIASDLTDA